MAVKLYLDNLVSKDEVGHYFLLRRKNFERICLFFIGTFTV